MTCEDTTPTRITWEIQLYETVTGVWMCRDYGRATTLADPTDLARAALAGYLAHRPPRATETFRASARVDDGPAVIVTADQLPDDWAAGPDVRQALPLYLREALPTATVTGG